MNRYQMVRQLGDGSFGTVWLANTNSGNSDRVAVKKMKRKFFSWDECVQLREVKSLKRLQHRNIIRLREVIREHDELYFIFDFMEGNLYQLTLARKEKCRRGFQDGEISMLGRQMLEGLSFMHQHGFFHRDMKPENVLIQKMPEDITNIGTLELKLADFGLAREIRSLPPYTEYVSTRWYRAPEIILRSSTYSSPIDIWATGCILYELYALQPLFCGSSDLDQLFKITSLLGTPGQTASLSNGGGGDWPEGEAMAARKQIQFTYCMPTPIEQVMKDSNLSLINLIRDMLRWDPAKRPTAQLALGYPFFSSNQTYASNTGTFFKPNSFSSSFAPSSSLPPPSNSFAPSNTFVPYTDASRHQNSTLVSATGDDPYGVHLSDTIKTKSNDYSTNDINDFLNLNTNPGRKDTIVVPQAATQFDMNRTASSSAAPFRSSLPRSELSIEPRNSSVLNQEVDDLLKMDTSAIPIFQAPATETSATQAVPIPTSAKPSTVAHKESLTTVRSPLSWLSFHSRKTSTESQKTSASQSPAEKRRPAWLRQQQGPVAPPTEGAPQPEANRQHSENRFYSWLKPQSSGNFSSSASTTSSGIYASAKQSLTGAQALSSMNKNQSVLINNSVIGSNINESNILFGSTNAADTELQDKPRGFESVAHPSGSHKQSKSIYDDDISNLLNELSRTVQPPAPPVTGNTTGSGPAFTTTNQSPLSQFETQGSNQKKAWLQKNTSNADSRQNEEVTCSTNDQLGENINGKSKKVRISLPSWLQSFGSNSSNNKKPSSPFFKSHSQQSPPLQLK